MPSRKLNNFLRDDRIFVITGNGQTVETSIP